MTTRYLLNSAVIAVNGDGNYAYRTIGQTEAVDWLQAGEFTSRIGYQNTADFIERISGTSVEVFRATSELQPGDEALVVRLAYRETNPGAKASQTAVRTFSRDDFVFGLLTRQKDRPGADITSARP